MLNMIKKFTLLFVFILLASCSDNSPGPLEGTWRMSGLMPMTMTFSDGEVSEMGAISPVSYKVDGSVVIMTYEDGLFKGNKIRYVVNGNTARTDFGSMIRISK